jgi:hypothetical protein
MFQRNTELLYLGDGGNKYLCNTAIHPAHYKVSIQKSIILNSSNIYYAPFNKTVLYLNMVQHYKLSTIRKPLYLKLTCSYTFLVITLESTLMLKACNHYAFLKLQACLWLKHTLASCDINCITFVP